jgi:hypothetical protein
MAIQHSLNNNTVGGYTRSIRVSVTSYRIIIYSGLQKLSCHTR